MTTVMRHEHERQTAAERRDAILDAAVAEFATYGLHGASTVNIARRVGISQPYIFRLFGTKKELFLAAADRVWQRIVDSFRDAVAADPQNPFHAMGRAYSALLANREEFLMLLQAFAASADRDVQNIMRERFAETYARIEAVTSADPPEIQAFIATGMLLMITTALDVPALVGKEDWATKLMTDPHHPTDE